MSKAKDASRENMMQEFVGYQLPRYDTLHTNVINERAASRIRSDKKLSTKWKYVEDYYKIKKRQVLACRFFYLWLLSPTSCLRALLPHTRFQFRGSGRWCLL